MAALNEVKIWGNIIIDWAQLGISLLRSVQFCLKSVAVISDTKAQSFSPFHISANFAGSLAFLKSAEESSEHCNQAFS
jgi:hypothetical protein